MDTRILCLGVLNRGPASGYEIRKAFEEGPFAHFQDASFGSIYPALRRLAEDGLIRSADPDPEGRPEKKVYRITQAGREALYDAVAAEPAPDRVRSDFLFVLFFGHLLPPARLDRLVDERVAEYRRCLADMRDMEPQSAAERFVLGFGVRMYEEALRYLEEHRHELLSAAVTRPKVAE